MGVNNLPKVVVTRQCRDRELTLQPMSRESNALTTRPLSHHLLTYLLDNDVEVSDL